MDIAHDINLAVDILNKGGIILYPTDTIWGIGCDASNENAVKKIYTLKQRTDSKSMIMLLSANIDISNYANDEEAIKTFLATANNPTTAIYNNAKNLANNLTAD